MFVCMLSYARAIAPDEPLHLAHRDFVQEQVRASRYLAAGPRIGTDGGVVIAYGDDADAVRALVERDPYILEGVATYELHQFKVGLADPASSLAGAS